MVLRRLRCDPIAVLIVMVMFTVFGFILTFFRVLTDAEWAILMIDIMFSIMGIAFFAMSGTLFILERKRTDYTNFVLYFMIGMVCILMLAATTMLAFSMGSATLTPQLGPYFDQFAAISEDLFFCGMLALVFSFFKNYDFKNPWLVFFIVSVVILFQGVFFMLWHTVAYGGDPRAMWYVFGLRIILSAVFVLSGLLLTPILLHMAINFLAGFGG